MEHTLMLQNTLPFFVAAAVISLQPSHLSFLKARQMPQYTPHGDSNEESSATFFDDLASLALFMLVA
jgi:hypothetical protein